MKHTGKLTKTILSLILVLAMLVGCGLMFAGCADSASSEAENNEQIVEDLRNDPAQYEGLEKEALLRKLATNHLNYYKESVVANAASTNSGKLDMTLTVGDTIMDLLEQSAGTDLSFLKKINLSMDMGIAGETTKIAAAVGLNGKDIATLKVLMDMSDRVMYMGIPELNSTWIEFDMTEATGSYASDMTQLTGAMPDAQMLSDLFSRYLEIALAKIDNVEQSTKTLSVGGITQDCTALTLKVYKADVLEAAKAVLTEAKNDTQIKTLIQDLAGSMGDGANPEEAYASFQEMIDESLAQVDKDLENATNDKYLQLVTYVDSKYNIAGMELTTSGFETSVELSFYNLIENGKFAFEANFPDMIFRAEESKIVGSGTVNGSKTTGTYTWKVEQYDFLVIEVKDLDMNSGTVTLKPTEDLLDELGVALPFVELGLQLKYSQNSVELNLMSASTLLLGISLKETQSNGPSISKPSDVVDATDSTQMQQWAENLDLDKLFDNLKKAGVPADLIDMIEESINAEPEYAGPEYVWSQF